MPTGTTITARFTIKIDLLHKQYHTLILLKINQSNNAMHYALEYHILMYVLNNQIIIIIIIITHRNIEIF